MTISSFLYPINWSFGSTIWKINTSQASERRTSSSRHNLPVKAKIPTLNNNTEISICSLVKSVKLMQFMLNIALASVDA